MDAVSAPAPSATAPRVAKSRSATWVFAGIFVFFVLDIGFWALSAIPLGRLDPAFVLFGRWWAIIALLWCVRDWRGRRRIVLIPTMLTLSNMLLMLIMYDKGISFALPWQTNTQYILQFVFTLAAGLVFYALAEIMVEAAMTITVLRVRRIAGIGLFVLVGFAIPQATHGILRKAYEDRVIDAEYAKAPLNIMTALPLSFGNDTGDMGKIARGAARPHPALVRLARKYSITMVDAYTEQAAQLDGPTMLVQPQAMSPEELVRLDESVRDGRLLVILADPDLDWEPLFPLGDPRNPPPKSMLSPLLRYWGIDLPETSGAPIIVKQTARSPVRGAQAMSDAEMRGRIQCYPGIEYSQCRIGKGRVAIFTDVDFLDIQNWAGPGANGLNAAGWRGQKFAVLEAYLTQTIMRSRTAPLLHPVWIAKD